MKKIFILLAFLIGSLAVSAQTIDKTVTVDQVVTVKGGAADTVIKNGTGSYAIYVKDFSESVVVQTKLTRTSGAYTKARVITQGSYDNTNWTSLDTNSYAGTAVSYVQNTGVLSVKYPYVKTMVKPYDSTATIKFQHIYLIDKN